MRLTSKCLFYQVENGVKWGRLGDYPMSYPMSYELKDYLNSINFTKENLMSEEDPTWEKKYPPFIVNKCLSGFIDTVMFANEMNVNHQLPSRLQYDFLINTVRKRKRFSPWLKRIRLMTLMQ